MLVNCDIHLGQSKLVRSSQGTTRCSLKVLGSEKNDCLNDRAAASSYSTFVKVRRCSFFSSRYLFEEIDLINLCYDLVKLIFVKCGTE